MAALVSMSNLLNGKDSRWLQLEVCREFQRNKCSRPDTECKFAHPPPNVEVQNGRVTACYDSIKVIEDNSFKERHPPTIKWQRLKIASNAQLPKPLIELQIFCYELREKFKFSYVTQITIISVAFDAFGTK